MASYRLSPQAEADLDDIWTYHARRDAVDADLFTYKLLEQCVLLAEFPLIGVARPELAPNLRSMVYKKYIIFYRPATNGVEVARILHGSRDIQSLFEEEG